MDDKLDRTGSYGTCTTAAATTEKVVTLTDFTLATGARIIVKFTYANTAASPTLNVNSTGAKSIMSYGTTAAVSGEWVAGEVVSFVYDGSYWVIENGGIQPVVRGGTGLSSAPSMLINLASTTAASPFESAPRPGVTGTLPVARGGTGQTSLANFASSLKTNLFEIKTRTGTGTYGSENPSSITFNIVPKVIIRVGSYQSQIIAADNFTTAYVSGVGFSIESGYAGTYGKKSSNGKTFYWYNTNSASRQINTSGTTYTFIAFA